MTIVITIAYNIITLHDFVNIYERLNPEASGKKEGKLLT